mmetsp:Transcript_10761/g.22772  ORF Transcript_10761/g.22772 Transcript_10761/m.22772 type:complete len:490 (-) Transcript_10761:570-2039(-)
MFSLFNGIYDSYLAPTQLNLLVVGAPESGKTTLLERLKVTEIPTRPRSGSGGSKTVQQRIGAEELPATLRDALVETGALEGRSRLRNRAYSSTTSLASGGSDRNGPLSPRVQKQQPRTPGGKNISINNNNNNNIIQTSTGNALVVTEKRRRFSICPAPERYSRSAQDQDEDFADEETEELLLGGGGGSNDSLNNKDITNGNSNGPPRRVRCHSREFDVDTLDLITDGMDDAMDLMANNTTSDGERWSSMRSIGLGSDHQAKAVTNKALRPAPSRSPPQQLQDHDIGPSLLHESSIEYNVKANAKMLPFRMIRPTIGTNLAKTDMYGAKCHIFDVGGRLQDIWERYYDDCDAVIFCWKLGEDPDKPPKEPDSDDDSDDEEDDPNETIYKKQQEMLNDVRKSIPDDVPFLVLGHVFGNANPEIVDRMYTTDILLPRYHNPMTGFCCSSAKTGAGVQSAMEWLIPLAKRQQKERIASKRELDTMLEEQGKSI